MKMMRKALVIGMTGALASGLAFAAFAQGSTTNEVNTAHAHAMMAEGATTLAMSHTHLHHVINCLVGPKGAGFDVTADNPCKGQGNGAILDSASNSTLHSKLESALADAQTGLKSNDLSGVHSAAAKTAAALAATPAQKAGGGYSW